MNDFDRIKELMDAREEAARARLDRRLEERLLPLEAKVDSLRELMNERFAAMEARFAEFKLELREMNQRIDAFQRNMIGVAVAAVLTVILGVGAINASLVSNMRDSFKDGQGAGSLQAETNRLLQEMRKDIDEIRKDQAQMRKEQAEFRARTESQFKQIDGQFKQIDTQFKDVRREIGQSRKPPP